MHHAASTLRKQLLSEGFAILRSVVDKRVAAHWDDRFERTLPLWAHECDVPLSSYLSAVCRWKTPNPLITEMAQQLGSLAQPQVAAAVGKPVRLSGSGIFRKSVHAPTGTHAHQDASYRWKPKQDPSSDHYGSTKWAEDGEWYAFSSWLALTDVGQQGALEVLPRSHLGEVSVRPDFLEPDFVDRAATQHWKQNAVTLQVKAGDMLIFDAKLWHSSSSITHFDDNTRRTALALRWETDEAMPLPPSPNVDPMKYGMETSGAHIKAAMLHLLEKSNHPSRGELSTARSEQVFAACLQHDVFTKNKHILEDPATVEKLLRRYMLLRKAGGMHNATAQNEMVWEPLFRALVRPVLHM
eukprot:TRINITY_DN67860_c8_g1_i1.p1 TRINITY_DN67860_c8_g1~~TRINITY_DN67860_c8_g1_i1.p1  ORF type:complete len:354 (-),score=27.39 TRINITY_DN67860_c8_g1_i1:62-1123(-)